MATTLPNRWCEYLKTQPETGMGYQIVRLTLTDGRIIDDVAIIESHIIGEIRGRSDFAFDPESIVAVEITHNKWDFASGAERE